MTEFKCKENYQMLKKIGQNKFWTVYQVLNNNDKKIYVIKQIILNKKNEKEIDKIKNEIEIIKSLIMKMS